MTWRSLVDPFDVTGRLTRYALGAAGPAVDRLVRAGTAAVVDRLDLDGLAARIDVDRIADRMDVMRVARRIDIDLIADRVDVDRIADRVDVNRVTARVDADEIAARLDVDRIAARIDVVAGTVASGEGAQRGGRRRYLADACPHPCGVTTGSCGPCRSRRKHGSS
ncbi:hypothetical protein ACWCRD_33985 [Streptomyces sp. NPDC002092]